MGTKRVASKKIRLTKDAIEKMKPQASNRYVYDMAVPGLAVRITPKGTKSFAWVGKRLGRTQFKTLGRVETLTIPQARRMATELSAEAARQEETLGEDDASTITIEDAFAATVKKSKIKPDTRGERDWNNHVKKFMDWLKKRYPKARHWRQLNRGVLEKYLDTFEGLADNTKRLRVMPIVQTSRHMAARFGSQGVTHFADQLGISNKPLHPPARIYLSDALAILDWIREHCPYLETGATLQALAGLRVTEVLRLTWDKVDLERGLLEVSGVTKNTWSHRVIPLCGPVVDALKRADAIREKSKVKNLRGAVVTSEKGYAYRESSVINYGKSVTTAIRQWHQEKSREYLEEHGRQLAHITWAAKDLRNVLPTLAFRLGLEGAAIWEQYIGHAPRTVTERHYLPRLSVSTEGEQEKLLEDMDNYRRLVVSVIEREIEAVQTKTTASIETVSSIS